MPALTTKITHFWLLSFQGDLRTNVPDGGRNAVTWGIFPAKEVIQTTIIERDSFLSWKVCIHTGTGLILTKFHLQTEAFSIWSEWASFYPPRSEERELLESVRDKRWLVSLVHHDYKDKDALWNFLLIE